MSDLNLQWVQENFAYKSIIMLNIGCADIQDDTLRFATALPDAKVYSFECASHWKAKNLIKSKFFGLHYEHKAVSYFDGQTILYEGTPERDAWQWISSLSAPRNQSRVWRQEVVDVVCLNTWCRQQDLRPDFLHIDAEGEEYNILKNLDNDLWPQVIWLEYQPKYNDQNQCTVSFDQLDQLMIKRHYQRIYKSADVLYVSKNTITTSYRPCLYSMYHSRWSPDSNTRCSVIFTPWTPHEKTIQQKIWVKRYQIIKDPTWPAIQHPNQFFQLPDYVQQECKLRFDFVPTRELLE